jgi:quercetin dioxygenase-like cupin family protein
MAAKLTRGSGTVDEDSIVMYLTSRGLQARRWSNGPGDLYAAHAHDYDKILYCLRGSITFTVDGGEAIELHPGDRLDIDAGTPHSASVGMRGCACVEAAVP